MAFEPINVILWANKLAAEISDEIIPHFSPKIKSLS